MMELWKVLCGYVAANGIGLGIKVGPVILLAILLLIEWYTSSVFGKAGLCVLVVTVIVSTLDIVGKLPTIASISGANEPRGADNRSN